jgi:MFS family permease
MIKNINAITLATYFTMFFLGVAGSLIGAAARNIGLDPYQIGLLTSIQNVGFMISVSISGALADTHDKPKILAIGSLILAVSFLGFYQIELFWINILIMLFIGIGVGAYEGVTDALLLDIHPKRAGFHISINHFFVTFGSIIITAYLIFLQMNWRNSLQQAAVIVLLLAIFFALARVKSSIKQTERFIKRLQVLIQEKIVIILFFATAVTVGVEIGSISILTTFLMDQHNFSQVTSKIGLIIFLSGIAVGRVIIGFLTRRGKIVRNLITMFGFAVLIYSGLYFMDLGAGIYLAVFLAGFSLSALLPLILTLAGLYYPDSAGTAMGAIKVAIPIGGIVLPLAMSIIAKNLSFQLSLIVYPLSLLVAFVFLSIMLRGVRLIEISVEE